MNTIVMPTGGWLTVPWLSARGLQPLSDIRLCFLRDDVGGGAPNPPTRYNFSGMAADLANEINICKDWNPKANSEGQTSQSHQN